MGDACCARRKTVSTVSEKKPGLVARGLLLLVRGYQRIISPPLHWVLGPWCGCRFTPTCSEYMRQAVMSHGFVRGGWLGVKRICRCHPWSDGGVDEVPLG